MLILHATAKERDLLFWAEAAPAVGVMPVAATGKAKPRSHQSLPAKSLPTKSLPHPFAAPAADLIEAMETVGFTVDADNYSTLQATIWLPTADSAPLASSPLIAPNESANSPAAASSLSPWQLAALRLPMATLVELLTLSSGKSLLAPGLLLGADLSFWTMALRFAAALVTRQQFLPVLDKNDVNNSYGAWWQPVFTGMDTERLMKLTRAMPHSCRALSDGVKEPPRLASEEVLAHFLGAVVDYLVRVSPNPPLAVLPKRAGPVARPSLAPSRARPVFDSVHDEWLYALTAADNQMVGDPTDLAQLSAQVKEWQRAVTITTATPWRLCFRLEEPPAPAAEIREDEDSADIEVLNKRHSRHGASMATDEPEINQSWQVRYLLQACDDPSLLIPTENAWQSQEGLSRALRSKALSQDLGWKPARVREYLLAALGQAASLCPGVEDSLKSSAPGGYTLDDSQAHAFLTQHAWLLEQAGFGVFLPAWWTRKGTKLQLTTRANVKSPKMQGGNGLSLEEIIKFEWQVALGGETLTLRELEALARLKSPLVRFRGQWVQLSAEEIQAALNFWKERSTTRASVRELLRMAIGADAGASALAIEGVQASGWVGDLLSQLQGHVAFEEAPQPKELQGQLRPYQVRGYSWLRFLQRWGLGACLADDMGLGKTIQFLALLQQEWSASGVGARRPTLLICPTSVVSNWQKEAERFTPELPVIVHHGLGRTKGATFKQQGKRHALVLSSYALLHRDLEILKAVDWAGVVLDEAQNIKNPETKQARAARALRADYRIALTGTPVENNIGDLWSIMEFLNPGLLGGQSEFKRRFFTPIQISHDPAATQRLKQITGPFILRRLKTDKSVITDLPDKMEMKVFCSLTKEQASLYAAVVEAASKDLEASDGIQRKGIVLATLSKLKQVCNHPAQFLGDNSAIPGRSGKLARLSEMMEEILSSEDNVLIFTQFREMGDLIQRHLQETFGQETLFLHGGASKKARDRMVERFQGKANGSGGTPRIFILSLKAGGVGLNLTRANHVFHFDRWWNPAVENQATDRAFRIGQVKNVQVHKFLCAGTLEEKIDEMIERKQSVASQIVGTGESWLTELSTTELKGIFALRSGAVSEDGG